MFSHMQQAPPHHVVKLSPQPQLPFELGFLKTNSDLHIHSRITAMNVTRKNDCHGRSIPPRAVHWDQQDHASDITRSDALT
jgi:hypothetical protein